MNPGNSVILFGKKTKILASRKNAKGAIEYNSVLRPELYLPAEAYAAPKRKFGNIPVVIDGILFPSTLEGARYNELKTMALSGEIVGFERQKTYNIEVNGQHICQYRADFVVEYPDGTLVVEDTKGVLTPEYKIKSKLMLAVLGIKIKEIYAKKEKAKSPRSAKGVRGKLRR